MDLDPAALNAAVDAAIQVQIRQEIERTSDFDPGLQQFRKAIGVLGACDNHTFVLVAFSLLSTCIGSALSYNLRFASKKDRESLLEGLGPLSTDSARIRLIKALGWLPDRVAASVNCMRQQRNRVAHSILQVEEINLSDLITAEYRSHCNGMRDRWLAVLRAEDGRPLISSQEEHTFWVGLLAYETTLSIVYAPGRQRIFGDSGSISLSSRWDEMPSWEKTFFEAFIEMFFRTRAE